MQKLLLGLVLLAVLAAGSPWIGYVAGLANVEGRPELPVTGLLSAAELELLHLRLRKAGTMVVPRLSPFDYALGLVNDPERLAGGGIRAAGVVAEGHMTSHVRARSEFWSRLSRAALTVWLTQNWTSDQILARAFEIENARRDGR